MQNIKLIIAYDGTAYLGWQKANIGPSIEATLQAIIEKILQHPIILQAASRTDAGVHSEGQVVNFLTTKIDFDLNKFQNSLNRLLPKDIIVLHVEDMPLSFHPTLHCIGKEYRYFVCMGQSQLPYHRFYSWHVPYRLQIDTIHEACPYLIGSHDFSAFCNAKIKTHYSDYMREVQLLQLIELDNNRLCFRIQGNHFLYKMVRNLVGTLIYIGRGKIPLQKLIEILESRDRPKAGITAPAHGLFLQRVIYENCE